MRKRWPRKSIGRTRGTFAGEVRQTQFADFRNSFHCDTIQRMKHTDEQAKAITDRSKRICVSAGAGSGKTYVLVERIVSLLNEGAEFDGIVAITFTEKAAAEMKARLRKVFRERAKPDNPVEMNRWRDYERRLDTARVSTIHAFCMRLLKENALHLGLDPDFGLLSEPESRFLSRDVARETLLELIGREDEHALRLTSEWSFRAIVRMLLGLLPKAGLLRRVSGQWPLENAEALAAHWRTRLPQVLLEESRATATLRELREMRAALAGYAGACSAENDGREVLRLFLIARVDALLGEVPDFATLHAIGNETLNFKAPRGVKKNWESEAQYEALSKLQKQCSDFIKKLCMPPEVDEAMESRTAEFTIALLHVLEELSTRIVGAKRRRNALDFDDLVMRCAQALATHEALRERAAAEIQHLLMDEFQDTDHAQLGIAEALCGCARGPQLFVVGDAKQSIYRFRGAEVEVFREEREKAQQVLPLARNFRSAPGILNFVNDYFLRSTRLSEVEPEFGVLEAHREASHAPGVEFLVAEESDGERLSAGEARKREAALVAARITELCAGSEIVWDARREAFRQPQAGDFAILLRAMSNVHLYEEALRQQGIPYGVVAGAGFFERQEVMDILNLLKVSLDPHDEPALLAVLRGPLCALSDDALVLLCEAGSLSRVFLGDAIPSGMPEPELLAHARAFLNNLRERVSLPVNAFMDYLLATTHCEALLLAQPNGVQRASNLRKLADLAEEFVASGKPSLRAFTNYLDEMRSAAVREGDALLQPQETGAVTLMTVHKSKGLEFPIVIVADASAKSGGNRADEVPTHRQLGLALTVPGETDTKRRHGWKEMITRRNRREELDEHARLLYVALTRARDYLIVSGAPAPPTSSWMGMLDQTLGALTRRDGENLSGEGWHGVVRRIASASTQESRRAEQAVDWDALFARAVRPAIAAEAMIATSISELLNYIEAGLGQDEERGNRSDESFAPRSYALTRGTVVHRLLELWDFGKAAPPIEQALDDAPISPSKREELRESMAPLASRFEQTPFYQELAGAETLLREHPFVLNVAGLLVRGTIDALMNGDVLVDYKTGRHAPARHERYLWQLRIYAAACRDLTGQLPTRGVLCYLDEGEKHETTIRAEDADQAMALAAEIAAKLRNRVGA